MSTTTRSGLARVKVRKFTGSDSSITSRVRSSCSPMRALITTGWPPWALLPGEGRRFGAAGGLAGAAGRLSLAAPPCSSRAMGSSVPPAACARASQPGKTQTSKCQL